MGGGKEVIKLLVGNKIDQPRAVQRQQAEDWARSRGMLFMEASAKTKEGINLVFDEVVLKILENPTLLSNTRPQKAAAKNTANVMASNNAKPAGKSGCC